MTHSAHPDVHPVIAGTVLPLQRAQELLATLPGVVSVRIVASDSGGVSAIHLLTTGETAAKQMVRNVESALMAHLGMRVDHRKVSVATTIARPSPTGEMVMPPPAPVVAGSPQTAPQELSAATDVPGRRTMYFEDVEIRGSRARGVGCRVTLRRGDELLTGEAEGSETDRGRVELAARAAVSAIASVDGQERRVGFEGCRIVDAFDTQFVFVGVSVRQRHERALLTGSAEVKDSAETAAVLAVLDATNRWMAGDVA